MIYTIYPIKDTTIYQDDDRKDKNYGLDEILELAKFVSHSQVNGEKNSRILLDFTGSSISKFEISTGDVKKATLQIYSAKEEEISRDYNIIIGRGDNDWTKPSNWKPS